MNINAIKLLTVIVAATVVVLAPNAGGQAECPHEQVVDTDPCTYCRGMNPCPLGNTGNTCIVGFKSAWLNIVSGTYDSTKALSLGPVNIQCTQEIGVCDAGVCSDRDYYQWCYRSFSEIYVQVACD